MSMRLHCMWPAFIALYWACGCQKHKGPGQAAGCKAPAQHRLEPSRAAPWRRPCMALHVPQDSDLNGVVDVRYTGGARMLLLIEVGTGRWRIKIPVMVSGAALSSCCRPP